MRIIGNYKNITMPKKLLILSLMMILNLSLFAQTNKSRHAIISKNGFGKLRDI